MALWGGRFEGGPDALFKRFNDSLSFDHRLLPQDVRGSIAWARALARAGVLSQASCDALVRALERVASEHDQDPLAVTRAEDEDVHSYVERRLIALCGDDGKRLHTGRSRNDQVATDLRLWLREQIDARVAELAESRAALARLARREIDTILPGYTHLQRAQPTLLAHWALAYFEMLERDAERFEGARARTNLCPLGSGALCGTAYPIDREALAADLGFDGLTRNSLDAVSDRDFVVETLAASALCAVHLSRFAEDLIIYSSGEFGFVELGDSVTSGSSLMPQKKNPDALELIRGTCARIVGAHTALCVLLKGLPLAYNKDLQEDKDPLFDAMDRLSLCLRVMPIVLETMRVRRDVCLAAAEAGHANATDLADYLVGRGVPFREAHELVGRIVRRAIEAGVRLQDLPLEELQKFHGAIGPDAPARLSVEAVLARRDVPGGTAPARVRAALDAAEARLAVRAEARRGSGTRA